jgi:hypothetical protein
LDKTRKLFLPDKPLTVDFVLVPSATLNVRVRNNATEKMGPMTVELVGDTMPPGCSVVVTATTDNWGSVTLYEVPTSYAWRFAFADIRGLRSRPFTLHKAREYGVGLTLLADRQSKSIRCEFDAFGDPTGKDIRQEVLGDDPFAREPAPAAEQKRGYDVLRKVGEANRWWLGAPPADVQTFSYDFRFDDGTKTPYKVPKCRHVAAVVLQGVSYVSPLSSVTRAGAKDNVLIRRIEEKNGTIRLWYTCKKPVGVSAGNGVLGSWKGFFSMWVGDAVLEIDAKTLTPRREMAGEFQEQFANFVPLGDGTYAPRSIQVKDGSQKFDFRFRVYEPGLWLFAESRQPAADGKSNVIARTENVSINGQPGKVRQ